MLPTFSGRPTFAVLLCIGPDVRERARLADFLASIQRHEPTTCAYVVLVNDGHDPAALRAVLEPLSLSVVTLDNPRAGRGWGWAGGLTTGVLTALRWIAQHDGAVDFALKVDTDTLILGPFADQLRARFAADTGLGALGHYFNPNERAVNPHSDWRQSLRRLRAPVSLWGNPRWHVRSGLWGRGRRVRRLIDAALVRGYAPGEFCSGGGYALSSGAIESLRQQGRLDDAELFLDVPGGEDVIVGMLVRSVGLKLAEGGRNIFGTHASFFDSTQALLDDDCRILHPVKHADERQEEAVRAQLRRRSFPA